MATVTPAVTTVQPSTEPSCAFVQARISFACGVGFVLSAGFYIFGFALNCAFLGIAPAFAVLPTASSVLHLLATLVLGAVFQLTARLRLSERAIAVLDPAVLVIACALLSAMGASIPAPSRAGVFQGLLANALLLTLRGMAVPTSAKCTFRACVLGSAAAVGATWIVIAGIRDVPVVALLIMMSMWLAAATAAATLGSRVIYGLRREVREARRIGQYVLQYKIGEGGMGVVFRATHALLRRPTAVKVLPSDRMGPDAVARFEREVRATARLAHPNTVAIFDYGRTPERSFYYAMEYIDGLDLSELVAEEGPLPPERVVHLLRQICSSLAEAHAIGLIHRDIKPANVIVSQREGLPDHVKVVDFGLVKDTTGEAMGTTRAGTTLGTPMYMAPESILSPDSVGPATDVYAVAALGYYLLTGSHVFSGGTALEVYASHLHVAPVPPSERLGRPIPADLEQVILRGLEKDPAERIPTARDLRAALERCKVEPAWDEPRATEWWKRCGQSLVDRKNARRTETAPTLASALAIDLAGREP